MRVRFRVAISGYGAYDFEQKGTPGEKPQFFELDAIPRVGNWIDGDIFSEAITEYWYERAHELAKNRELDFDCSLFQVSFITLRKDEHGLYYEVHITEN